MYFNTFDSITVETQLAPTFNSKLSKRDLFRILIRNRQITTYFDS